MTKLSVLAIGLDPAFVDLSAFPQFTPELVRSYIDAQIDGQRTLGYDVESCLTDLGETAEAVTAAALKAERYDCVVIGAGLREPPERLMLFEKAPQSGAPARPRGEHLLQHQPLTVSQSNRSSFACARKGFFKAAK